jgi:GNAT superfamily N-acetyltransferase
MERETSEAVVRTQSPDIRKLGTADLDPLLAMYQDIGLLEPASPRQALEQTWARILASDLLYYLGVFVDGTLASTCHAVVVPNLSRGVRPYAIIENVGTLASHRRRGLGKLAMRAIIDHCWQAGCYKIMLASAIQRAGAHAFYEALGFDARAKQSFVLKGPTQREPPVAPGQREGEELER